MIVATTIAATTRTLTREGVDSPGLVRCVATKCFEYVELPPDRLSKVMFVNALLFKLTQEC